jgi:hypothetical protein
MATVIAKPARAVTTPPQMGESEHANRLGMNVRRCQKGLSTKGLAIAIDEAFPVDIARRSRHD